MSDLVEKARQANEEAFKKRQLEIIQGLVNQLDDEQIRHQSNTEYINQNIQKTVAAKNMRELNCADGYSAKSYASEGIYNGPSTIGRLSHS